MENIEPGPGQSGGKTHSEGEGTPIEMATLDELAAHLNDVRNKFSKSAEETDEDFGGSMGKPEGKPKR